MALSGRHRGRREGLIEAEDHSIAREDALGPGPGELGNHGRRRPVVSQGQVYSDPDLVPGVNPLGTRGPGQEPIDYVHLPVTSPEPRLVQMLRFME